jgi:hypothetical protein
MQAENQIVYAMKAKSFNQPKATGITMQTGSKRGDTPAS